MALQEHFLGVVVVLCFLAVASSLLLGVVARTSPVVKTEQIGGTIETISAGPLNPKSSIGRGFFYRYGVRLHENGLRVSVRGSVNMPFRVGHSVQIDRQYRQNGRVAYRLSGPAGIGL